jgi:hypothetical protein|tara:strand:- start:279 stop:458 length:180 start_codon:yes stop_codon:yes gene_type:complete
MNQEHLSSKSEDKKTKELENKVDRLEKTLELVKKTIDHDNAMKGLTPKEPLRFGNYVMT